MQRDCSEGAVGNHAAGLAELTPDIHREMSRQAQFGPDDGGMDFGFD